MKSSTISRIALIACGALGLHSAAAPAAEPDNNLLRGGKLRNDDHAASNDDEGGGTSPFSSRNLRTPLFKFEEQPPRIIRVQDDDEATAKVDGTTTKTLAAADTPSAAADDTVSCIYELIGSYHMYIIVLLCSHLTTLSNTF